MDQYKATHPAKKVATYDNVLEPHERTLSNPVATRICPASGQEHHPVWPGCPPHRMRMLWIRRRHLPPSRLKEEPLHRSCQSLLPSTSPRHQTTSSACARRSNSETPLLHAAETHRLQCDRCNTAPPVGLSSESLL